MTNIQEDVHYDGGPAKGDLIFNLLLGVTTLCSPRTDVGAMPRLLPGSSTLARRRRTLKLSFASLTSFETPMAETDAARRW